MEKIMPDTIISILDKNNKNIDSIVHQLAFIAAEAEDHPWSYDMILSAVTGREEVFIICNNDAICGYAVYSSVIDTSDLENITIAANSQGHSLGKKLLKETINILFNKGIKIFQLEVRKSNLRALTLYKYAGFKKDCIRRGYYLRSDGSREDAILMSYRL